MTWDNNPRNVLEEIYADDFTSALRDIALDALATVTRITNVDTGRLRGAWTVTIGTPSGQSVSGDGFGPFLPPQAVQARGKAKIDTAEIGDTIYIQNNVEYGVFVDERFLIVERAAAQTANKFGL